MDEDRINEETEETEEDLAEEISDDAEQADEDTSGGEEDTETEQSPGVPADIPVSKKEDSRALYIYDADDEPVDDRDLYRDYSADQHIPVRKKKSAEKTMPVPAAETVRTNPQKMPMNTVPTYTQSGVRASVNYEQAQAPVYYQPLNNTVPASGPAHSDNMPETHEKERHTSGRPSISLINTVISMITLCVAAVGIFIGFAYVRSHDQEIRVDQKRLERLEEQVAAMTDESSNAGREYVDAISLIDEEEKNEPPVPDDVGVDVENGKILTYDSYVGYSWVPVLAGVKTNPYDKNSFSVDDEYRMSYKVNGEVSSYFGIDVSSYQGDIDWNAARADGVEFAILRIGVRGYGEEGNIKLDEKFFQNYEGARDAGIDIGVYFYSQAISVDEAIEEANFVLEQLDGRELEYPVAFDWEPVDTTADDVTPRTDEVLPSTFNLSARAFCETIEDAGYKAMIYTNKKMAYLKYDLRLFDGYPVWLALYNTDMTYYYDFDIWQYGFGRVSGIEGDVDLDIAMIR